MNYAAEATSRLSLRGLATFLRSEFRLTMPYFPIVEFLEKGMVQIFPEFNWEIVPDKELDGLEGLTLPSEHLIVLPERVYMDAVKGLGRARFSVAHEVAHYLLISDTSVALCRSDANLPAYRDPEWQANTLAAELLMPPSMTVGMSAKMIAKVFGVSLAAAEVHIKTKRKEFMP